MSQATALTAAQGLKAALLDHGAGRVVSPWTKRAGGVSIELQVGRGPSSDPWHCRTHVAHLNHHTASATITADRLTPALYICKNGRTDLQGPLCNGYGGGDFYYRVITLGWANHPGLGGPAEFAGKVVPQDNGRPYLWGTEWDWPGLLTTPWPDEYLEWMARCNAGILDWLGRPAGAQGEHKDPWAPDRKVDRRLISRAQSISRTDLVWSVQPEGDDMFEDADRTTLNAIKAKVDGLGADVQRRVDWELKQLLPSVSARVDAVAELVRDLSGVTGDDEAKILAELDLVRDEVLAAVTPDPTQPASAGSASAGAGSEA